MKTLDEMLRDFRPGPFDPTPFYVPEGDLLEFFAKPLAYYGRWVNTQITMLLAQGSNDVIGFLLNFAADTLRSKIEPSDRQAVLEGRVKITLRDILMMSQEKVPLELLTLDAELMAQGLPKELLETALNRLVLKGAIDWNWEPPMLPVEKFLVGIAGEENSWLDAVFHFTGANEAIFRFRNPGMGLWLANKIKPGTVFQVNDRRTIAPMKVGTVTITAVERE